MEYMQWSKARMAQEVGVLPQNINRYLSGKSDPSSIIISLISRGLNPEWASSGDGEMMQEETPVKQADSGRLTAQRKEVTLEEAREHYEEKRKFFMPAIGPKMTPYPFAEGEVLIIDTEEQPQENDMILEATDQGPAITKWRPGTTPLGVVVHASKNRDTIRKIVGSNTKGRGNISPTK